MLMKKVHSFLLSELGDEFTLLSKYIVNFLQLL